MRPAHLLPLALLAAASGCRARAGEGRVVRALAGERRPIVFAHRGGGGEAPESTLPAFLAAARDPSVALEMDVHRTRDGHLVVIHDATVDRTTNGRGRVESMTLAELQRLDAGHCAMPGARRGTARRGDCADEAAARFPFRGKGIKIPTLDEVLRAVPRQALVSVELKEPGAEELVAASLRASGRLPRVLVGAADDDSAARLRRLLPEAAHYFPRRAATCLVLTGKLGAGSGACASHDVLATPPSAAGVDIGAPGMIAALHARGIPVVYFTVNDEAEMERLFRNGADGIYTDYPTRALRVRDRVTASRPATSKAPGPR